MNPPVDKLPQKSGQRGRLRASAACRQGEEIGAETQTAEPAPHRGRQQARKKKETLEGQTEPNSLEK